MNKNYRIMDLLNRYHLYLYSLGYKIQSINDNHCSITDYINAVEEVANLENKTIDELAKDIEFICNQYCKDGEKFSRLPQNNSRTIMGLEHFKEFISLCNKK